MFLSSGVIQRQMAERLAPGLSLLASGLVHTVGPALALVSVTHRQLWSENSKWEILEISNSYVLYCVLF